MIETGNISIPTQLQHVKPRQQIDMESNPLAYINTPPFGNITTDPRGFVVIFPQKKYTAGCLYLLTDATSVQSLSGRT